MLVIPSRSRGICWVRLIGVPSAPGVSRNRANLLTPADTVAFRQRCQQQKPTIVRFAIAPDTLTPKI